MRIIIPLQILIISFLAVTAVGASGVFYYDQGQFVYKAGVELNNVVEFDFNLQEDQDLQLIAGEDILFKFRDEFGINNASNLRNLTFRKEGLEVRGDVFNYEIKSATGHFEGVGRVIDVVFKEAPGIFGLKVKNQHNAQSSRLYNDAGDLKLSSTDNGLPVVLGSTGNVTLAQGGILSVEGVSLGFDGLLLKKNGNFIDIMFNNSLTDILLQGDGLRLYSNTAPTASDHLVTKGYVEGKGYLKEFPEPPLPVDYNSITGTQKNFEMAQHAHRASYEYVTGSWNGLSDTGCGIIKCPAGMVIVQGSGSRDSADCNRPGGDGCEDDRVMVEFNTSSNTSSMEVCTVGDLGKENDEVSGWIFCAGIGPLIGGQNVLN